MANSEATAVKEMVWETNGSSSGAVPPMPGGPTGIPTAPPQAPTPFPTLPQQPPALPPAQPAAQPLSLVEQLSADTGIPVVQPFQLDVTNPFGLQSASAPQQQQQSPVPDSTPALTALPGYQEFNSQFQQITGMSLQDTVAQLRQLTQTLPQIQQMYSQFQDFSTKGVPSLVNGVRDEVRLRYEWGDKFDQNMAQVKQAFQQLPPQMQQALNSLEGARLIYSRIAQTQGQQTQPLNPQTPRPMYVQSGTGQPANTNGGQPQKVPMSALLALTPEQYNSPEVQAYIDAGLVDTNA